MPYVDNPEQSYSFEETTVREDLTDEIAILDPTETTLLSLLEHVQVGQRKFDWPIDHIPRSYDISAISSLARFEGADAVFEVPDYRDRPFNVAQINTKAIDVSETSRVVEMAAVGDEYDYQGWRRLLEMGIDIDMALHYGTGRLESGGDDQTSGTSRVTHGLFNWIFQTGIHRNNTGGAGLDEPFTLFTGGPAIKRRYSSTVFENGGAAGISRDLVANSIWAPAWRNGFKLDGHLILCGTLIKQAFSDMSIVHANGADGSVNVRWLPAERRGLIDTIDSIEGWGGNAYIAVDRYLDLPTTEEVSYTAPEAVTIKPGECMIGLMPRFWKVGVLRGVGFKPLADVGDSNKGMLVSEIGLKALNPIAAYGADNLVTAFS